MTVKRMIAALFAIYATICCLAQQRLTLEECRELAVKNNRSLEQARINIDMAHYDRAIARANFYPDISATGSYLYNSLDLNLISDEQSAALRGAGNTLQEGLSQKIGMLQQAIQTNPALAKEYMQSQMWQTVLGALSQTDISQAVNAIGCTIDDLFHPDIHNVGLIGVSLKQPVFAGGKIVAANRMADLSEDLSKSRFDAQYQQTIVDVDQAYWQIVSIAAKKKLAENYADFLRTMEHDADILVQEGVYTASDQLAIKVKANEAAMMLTQATNGLALARMFLCKMIGLPLDSGITLADEETQRIPAVGEHAEKNIDEIVCSRPELKSLDAAAKIYGQKVKLARADMMPQISLTANYMLANPNLENGFQKRFGGFWTAGVVVKVPIFHGMEALKKTQKAKAEARLYHSKYEDAVSLVSLEVSQLYAKREEAASRLEMAKSNLDCAEENLRTAMLGFSEGVVESSVTLAAQSAWLKAHSECIDAGVELQMIEINLDRAEGNIRCE